MPRRRFGCEEVRRRDSLQEMDVARKANLTAKLTPGEREALVRGVKEINEGRFFEAHETIELAWTHCHSPLRPFLQAVIHVAVGSYHGTNGNRLGMERQFVKARRKLADFLPVCERIDTASLDARIARLLQDSQLFASGLLVIPRGLIPGLPEDQDLAEPPA